MAIPLLAPAPSRQNVGDSSPRGVLRLVPEIEAGAKQDRKTFVVFLSILGVVGLLTLLTINTLLAQDAFELRRLQAQATTLSDQREALMRQIDLASSPEVLASRATAEGMIPSQSPRFLTLTQSSVPASKR